MDEAHEPSRDSPRGPSTRGWRPGPVLPVLALVLAAVWWAASSSGTLSEQLRTSFSRVDQRFTELYFPDGQATSVRNACARSVSSVPVRFVVRAQGGRERRIAYRVVVRDSAGTRARTQGGTRVVPGQAATVRTAVRAPASGPFARPFTVRVTVPGTDQLLVAHCGSGS